MLENWKVRPRKVGKLEKWKNGKLGPENWKNGKLERWPPAQESLFFCRYLPVKIGKCRRMGGIANIYVYVYIYIFIYLFMYLYTRLKARVWLLRALHDRAAAV